MLGDTYLFIDGGYLQTVYRDQFTPVFGDKYLVDYHTVMRTFGARRAYLYDCLDDVQKPGETEVDFKARVEQQEARFDAIDKVEGLHVRYGYLSPGKKRQQKEVDVLLAVDMLTHSFNKNMNEAVLLSGDRDFRPVVESIVQLGTLVRVAYDPRTGSKPLARAADSETEIDLTTLCNWIKLDKFEERNKHFPYAYIRGDGETDPFRGLPGYCRGVIGTDKVTLGLFQDNEGWHATVELNRREYCVYNFQDKDKLLAFITKKHGNVVW
jgi:uncharacterized LabA/DUF88 family protein